MRIDALRFKNLNSLAGEWSVDFQDPAIAGNGIFAITGPTGAGKTTLLDGLCLALFGRTPRLKTISTAANEIMTRGTGDCFAEATFTTAKGRFRCHWSQRRARRTPEGRLQPPRHEIVDDADGTVLETKLRRVARRVTAVTGLDFDRFTRSILLAQGGFAAFLQAGPEERAPILEEITGTGIYSEISKGVHERLRREGAELDRLRTLLQGLELPDGEHEGGLKREQAELAGRLETTGARRRELAKALAWREQLAALEAELKTLAREAAAQEAAAAAARPDMERLARAEKAQPLTADHDRLKALRDHLAENRAARDTLSVRQKRLVAEIDRARSRSASAETRLVAARRSQRAAEAPLKAVRALDVRREAAARQVQDRRTACRTQQAAVDRARGDQAAARSRLADSQAALNAARTYLEAHPEDAGLTTTMAGIRHLCREHEQQQLALEAHAAAGLKARQTVSETEQALGEAHKTVKRLRAAEKTLNDRLAADEARFRETLDGDDLAGQRRRWEHLTDGLHRAERALELTKRREEIARQRSDLTAARKKLAAEAEAASRDEAACRKEKALREQAVADKNEALTLLRRVADLENERRHLRAGEPCPLCGGRDHPWADLTPPAPDDAQEAKEALSAAQAALSEAEKRLQSLIAAASRATSQLEAIAATLADLAAGQTDIDTALAATSLPVSQGEGPPTAAALARTIADQRKAVNHARDQLAAAESLEKALKARRCDLERARTELAAGENHLQGTRFAAEAAAREAARLTAEGNTLAAALQNTGSRLLAELGPYGVTALPEAGAAALLKGLERRLTDYEHQQAAADRWQTTLNAQTHAVALETQRLEQATAQLSQAQGQLESAVKAHAQVNRERSDLFGDKDPDQEEARLAEAVTEAEGRREAAARETAAREQAAVAAAARHQSLAEQGDRLRAEVTAAQTKFNNALGAAGFRDEAHLADARLSAAEMDHLAARKKALAETAATLAARREDRAKALAEAQTKRLTTATREALAEKIDALDVEREQLQTRNGAICEQLAQIAKTRDRQAEILARCEGQSAVCERWGRLHDLIGSADGKKFRVFAQGLTFEQVVTYANQELQKMSDRYIMVRDHQRPLNLLMADDYQGGVLRATDNLSGGESFLVSLALALGLAKMASRNVRLDSLFLDEGFGTLDEETLEIALETLASLHQEGKLIGVISHVATLKERIPVQIKVFPGNSGRSRLEGPGCIGSRKTSA